VVGLIHLLLLLVCARARVRTTLVVIKLLVLGLFSSRTDHIDHELHPFVRTVGAASIRARHRVLRVHRI